MDNLSDQDFIKLKELLQYAGEFIAYFELADTKMLQWREEIAQNSINQQELLKQQLENVQQELAKIIEALTQVGIDRLSIKLAEASSEGRQHLTALQEIGTNIINKINDEYKKQNEILQKNIELISEHTEQSLTHIDRYLASYDVKNLRRTASESCLQVEKASYNAIKKSSHLLKLFHWRTFAVALITTAITVCAFSLYIINELPWETHKKVLFERAAGKVLIRAWPGLTQQEKNKILNNQEKDKI